MITFKKIQLHILTLILVSSITIKGFAQKKQLTAYNLSAQYLIWQLDHNIPKEPQKIGFLGQNGKIFIEPKFSHASDFFGNYANVIADSTFGYINKKGNMRLFPGYQNLYWYFSDIGIAKKNEKYGLIDREGKEITKIDFDHLNIPSEGYFSVSRNKKKNFIDKDGNFLFNDSINITGSYIHDGKTVFEGSNRKRGLIDINSHIVIPALYDDLVGFFYEGLMRVKKGKKYGFINNKGEEVIPLIYEEIGYSFKLGYVTAKKDGKWGIIDAFNKNIIPFDYEGINNFSEGLALVIKDKKYGYVNKKNKLIIPIKYPLIWQADFSGDLAVFKLNDKFGYINKLGDVILPAIYDQASQFKAGIAHVILNGNANFINKKGKQKFHGTYKEVYNENEGLFKFLN